MTLLPLGKSNLPVVMEELSKAGLAVYAKVHDNRIGVTVSEVTEPPEHLDQLFLVRGLGFLELPIPFILGVFWFAIIGGVRFTF